MNKILRNAILTGVLGISTWSGFGCKVELELPTYYKGTPYTKDVAWSSGQALYIHNVTGELKLVVGDSDKIVVTVQPFTRADDDASAKKEMEEREALEVLPADASNPVRILASTSSASTFTGYDLLVQIPSSFDASMQVEQTNGTVKISGVANAIAANVRLDNGELEAVLDNAFVTVSSGNGDVAVWVSGSRGGDVTAKHGSIDFHIPGTANANLRAWTTDGGPLSVVPSVPATWKEIGATESGKTWQCNQGSNETYNVTASGSSLAAVVIHVD